MDIKFKGRRVDNGNWIFGDLIQWKSKGRCAIVPQEGDKWVTPNDFEIVPETACLFTGMYDFDGVEVYMGDVLRNTVFQDEEYVVVFSHGRWQDKCLSMGSFRDLHPLTYDPKEEKIRLDYKMVVRNIHDL